MLFDATKLPKEKWLSLCDVVHICAFGEPYVNGICEAGYPSDRAFKAEINETAQRCLSEAGTAPKHSTFVELLNKPGLWQADAVAPLLFKCKPWPPSGKRLCDLFAQYDEAQADELKKLEAATTQLEGCLMYGEVVFEGDHNGLRERIEPSGIYGSTIIWQNRTVSAHPRDPQAGMRLFVWQEVLIERASLLRWISENESTASEQATSAEAAVADGSKPPASEKMTPGARPYHTHAAIEVLARKIAARPKVTGVTPAKERLIEAIQEGYKTAFPTARALSRSTVQRSLKRIDWSKPGQDS